MSKETSVAPTERVNIVYQSATGNAQEQVELPLKILMLGDFTGKPDERPIEERAPINVDKDNFNDVMAQQNLQVTMSVPDKLSQEEGVSLPVTLQFRNVSDFTPESIVHQVPELEKLLRLRASLHALKGPLGNIPAFRRKLQDLLNDADGRQALMRELGMKSDEKSEPKQ
jgi:type VI secretion system protein ImpB